jgi:hypothetical protein
MTTGLLRLRSGLLLVALLLFLHPLHLSAQSSAGSIQFNPAMSREAEYQVEPLGWAVPVRFRSGAPREIGSAPLILAAVRSSEGVTAPTSRLPSTLAAGWLKRAASRELARLKLAAASTDSALLRVQQPGQRNRSWIGRHPVLFGTLVGLGGGYLVGVGAGEDGIFDDFTAGENGLFVAGIGAGAGALVGAIVGAATK